MSHKQSGLDQAVIRRLFDESDLELVGAWEAQVRKAREGPLSNETTVPESSTSVVVPLQRVRRARPRAMAFAASVLLVLSGTVLVVLGEQERPRGAQTETTGPVRLEAAGDGLVPDTESDTRADQLRSIDSQMVVDEFVTNFASGASERLYELFASDASVTYRDRLGTNDSAAGNGGSGPGSLPDELSVAGTPMTAAAVEVLAAFYASQNAIISDVDCSNSEAGPPSVSRLRCNWRLHDAVTMAAHQAGDRVEASFTITGGKIVALDYAIEFDSPARRAFYRWISTNRPEVDEVFSWSPQSSPDEARLFGELIARYAVEWADSNQQGP